MYQKSRIFFEAFEGVWMIAFPLTYLYARSG